MLRFGKTVDYALRALTYLIEVDGGAASAGQIARTLDLPLPLLCKILKLLHHQGLLQSIRGSKGGYRIAQDLREVSFHDLMRGLRADWTEPPTGRDSPLAALQAKLDRALADVRLSDLVIPGRRIDVPVESVRVRRRQAAAVGIS